MLTEIKPGERMLSYSPGTAGWGRMAPRPTRGGRGRLRVQCHLDTVKKHVGHVLGKLGATNRTEAVARARELNLIP